MIRISPSEQKHIHAGEAKGGQHFFICTNLGGYQRAGLERTVEITCPPTFLRYPQVFSAVAPCLTCLVSVSLSFTLPPAFLPEKAMAPNSSTLAWKIPGAEEPGRLQSMSDTTERLHFHFSLSCIGEGNGNPLQCSCLENPRDGGAWWAAVYGITKSRTRLKRLSSSSCLSSALRWA